MAEAYVNKVADELADLALADQERTGDIGIVDVIGDVLGASSQTLQETYLTSVRVRRAEARARALLAQRAGETPAQAPEEAKAHKAVEDPPTILLEDNSGKDPETVPLSELIVDEDEPPTEPTSNAPRRVKR